MVEVARGSKSEKVLRQGFDKLPCYGSLKGVKESTLRDVARALVLQGYLEQTQGAVSYTHLTLPTKLEV